MRVLLYRPRHSSFCRKRTSRFVYMLERPCLFWGLRVHRFIDLRLSSQLALQQLSTHPQTSTWVLNSVLPCYQLPLSVIVISETVVSPSCLSDLDMSGALRLGNNIFDQLSMSLVIVIGLPAVIHPERNWSIPMIHRTSC